MTSEMTSRLPEDILPLSGNLSIDKARSAPLNITRPGQFIAGCSLALCSILPLSRIMWIPETSCSNLIATIAYLTVWANSLMKDYTSNTLWQRPNRSCCHNTGLLSYYKQCNAILPRLQEVNVVLYYPYISSMLQSLPNNVLHALNWYPVNCCSLKT